MEKRAAGGGVVPGGVARAWGGLARGTRGRAVGGEFGCEGPAHAGVRPMCGAAAG